MKDVYDWIEVRVDHCARVLVQETHREISTAGDITLERILRDTAISEYQFKRLDRLYES